MVGLGVIPEGVEDVGQLLLVEVLPVAKLDALDPGAPEAVEEADNLLGLPADHKFSPEIRIFSHLAPFSADKRSLSKGSNISPGWSLKVAEDQRLQLIGKVVEVEGWHVDGRVHGGTFKMVVRVKLRKKSQPRNLNIVICQDHFHFPSREIGKEVLERIL